MAVIGQARPLAPTNLRPPNLRTPLFIFGIALALVAFLVMFAFGIVFVGRTQPTGSVPVVVAKGQIDAREPITAEMLTLSSIPAAAVPAQSYLHIGDVKDMTAVVTIFKGQPISSNLVTSDPTNPAAELRAYLDIPAGSVGFAMTTGEVQGVAGYIAQGDYINVIAAIDTGQFSKNNNHLVTRTVFTNLRVIRVGPQSGIQKQGQAQGVASSITVVITQCDANYLDWLTINATLKYTLPSYHDYNKPAASDTPCTGSSEPAVITPAQIDSRWHFTTG